MNFSRLPLAAALLWWPSLTPAVRATEFVPVPQQQPAQQQPGQLELIAQRDAKKSEEVFRKNGWTFDYDAARKQARQQDRVVFAYFTRSYAECTRCESVESRVFDQEDFAAFAAKVVLFCHVTSHVEGDPYPDLLPQKGGSGWPFMAFLDADGNVLTRQSERSVASFHRTLAKCEAYLALDKRSRAGEPGLATDLLIAHIAMGGLTLADAKERAAAAGKLDDAHAARLADALLSLEVTEAFAAVRSRDDAVEVGKRFQKMWDEGRVPTGDAASLFFSLVMEAAAKAKDAAAYERALGQYEKVAPQGRNRERVLERLRARLEELKKG
ncbi:MAG: thioredoxin family protein [Planctomycetota bacterium]